MNLETKVSKWTRNKSWEAQPTSAQRGSWQRKWKQNNQKETSGPRQMAVRMFP